VVVLVTSMAACQPSRPAAADTVLTIVMHPQTSMNIGEELSRIVAQRMPRTTLKIEEKSGMEAITAVQDGTGDFALVYADMTYLAFAGQLDTPPFTRLRGVAALNVYPILLFVRGDSAIHDLQDLKGLRVNVGPRRGVPALTSQILLDALHIPVTRSHDTARDAFQKLVDGSIDAVFVVTTYPQLRLPPAIRDATRIVSFSMETADRIRRGHPFLRTMVIPRGVTGGDPILTVGADQLLVAREGLDPETVYQFMKIFLESLPRLSLLEEPLQDVNVENAAATPIPLHPGAARYFREQE
jgi:TRAP transporter TAXI family solute receptor